MATSTLQLTRHAGGVDPDELLRATRDAERALRELAAAQPASDLHEAIVGLADLLLLRTLEG
jgi:hypothetical protein